MSLDAVCQQVSPCWLSAAVVWRGGADRCRAAPRRSPQQFPSPVVPGQLDRQDVAPSPAAALTSSYFRSLNPQCR